MRINILWNKSLDNSKDCYGFQLVEDLKTCSEPIEIYNNIFYVLIKNIDDFKYFNSIKKETILNELRIFNNTISDLVFINDKTEIKKENDNSFNLNIDQNLTFNNYIEGKFNLKAVNLFKKILDTNNNLFNPIIVYSNTGLGKTHLVSAFANSFKKKYPNKKVKYIESNDFLRTITSSFVNDKNRLEELKKDYCSADLFIIEDIQFLSDKEKTNEIFFNIFNELIKKNSLVIITSDRFTEHLEGFEDRMISRFSSGVTIKIDWPDNESLNKILTNKLKEANLKLEDKAIDLICNYYYKDIRKLFGVINTLLFESFSKEDNHIFGADEVKKILNIENTGIRNNNKDLHLNPQIIINTISKFYNVSSAEIIGKSRKQEIANARHVAIYLLRKKIGLTLEEIGYLFSKRNHTTILSSIKKIEEQCKKDPNLQNIINDIYNNI